MKRVAEGENDLVIEIPAVVGTSVVAVQPALAVIVPLDVERVRVAVGVGNV